MTDDQNSEEMRMGDLTEEEFTRRFVARVRERLDQWWPVYRQSVIDSATRTAASYYENPEQRADGPEDCAEADISCWGES